MLTLYASTFTHH